MPGVIYQSDKPGLCDLVERIRKVREIEREIPAIAAELDRLGEPGGEMVRTLPPLVELVALAIWNLEKGKIKPNLARQECEERAAKIVAKNHPQSAYLTVGRGDLLDRIEMIIFFQKTRPAWTSAS